MEQNLDRQPTSASSIDLNDPQSVQYWTAELGCTKHELEVALKRVGNNPERVRECLSKLDRP